MPIAKDLARRSAVNGRQLNYAVQTTIDRIIFLRMAEDRGIEEYGRMLALTNGPNVYGRMLGLHERLAEARIEREWTVAGHQISATDRQIDALVYELYGLTDDEIKVVEEATGR